MLASGHAWVSAMPLDHPFGSTEFSLRDTVLALSTQKLTFSPSRTRLDRATRFLTQEASWPKQLVDVVCLTRVSDEDPGRGRAVRRLPPVRTFCPFVGSNSRLPVKVVLVVKQNTPTSQILT